MAAEYRDVAVSPGYRVGSDGTVWSERNMRGRLTGVWKQLKPSPRTCNGVTYYRVKLRADDGRRYDFYVHTLVLEAFVGPRPPRMQACHDDGNTANNGVGNLRWDTPKKNAADKYRHGTAGVKLSVGGAEDIRALRAADVPQAQVARVFGLAESQVSRIRTGATWPTARPITDDAWPRRFTAPVCRRHEAPAVREQALALASAMGAEIVPGNRRWLKILYPDGRSKGAMGWHRALAVLQRDPPESLRALIAAGKIPGGLPMGGDF
jgi:hypothetical protein